jgi:hypothetical protein
MAQSPDRTLDPLAREAVSRTARPYGPQWSTKRAESKSGPAYRMVFGVLGVVLIVVLLISVTLAI